MGHFIVNLRDGRNLGNKGPLSRALGMHLFEILGGRIMICGAPVEA